MADQLELDAGPATHGRPVGNIYYGTSSWTDRTLLASRAFYPPSARSAADRLRYYAQRFPLVEVDSTYYALPSERNAALWAERTPPDFIFNIKAYGLLTHHPVTQRSLPGAVRRLLPRSALEKEKVYLDAVPEEGREIVWSMFESALRPLAAAGKLGAVLFQFPRWFVRSKPNIDHLRQLPERLSSRAIRPDMPPVRAIRPDMPPVRLAVEFRGGGWMDEDRRGQTLDLLERLGVTYVVVDEPQGFKSSTPPVVARTSDLAMIRFHGQNAETWEARDLTAAERFRYLYSEEELRRWVEPVRELAGRAGQLHLLMNNCYRDYGVRNAAQLAALVAASR